MSSRNGRESLFGTRITPVRSQQQHRRGQSLVGIAKESDENLDLFSKNRRTLSVASSDESSDVSVKLGRLSVGSAKVARNGMDDSFPSTDGGKHDYDWLLTPPGTPDFPPSGGESQSSLQPPRSSSLVKSASTAKASRLSVSQSENNHSRPPRSSSVSRASISNSQYSIYSSNRSSSILNTSSASVSSYIRPSSSVTRSPSTARPSTPSSRPTLSRPSTPSKARPVPASSAIDRSRPSQRSRPSTPSSRPQIPANLHSQAAPSAQSLSRPSTPTHRTQVPSLSPAPGSSTSAGHITLSGRNSAPSSRPGSPGPRVRPPPQPVVPPDFPLETPPNLRTTLPDRPVSAGRSRSAVTLTLKGNSENQASTNTPRRHSSPIVTRGRSAEPPRRVCIRANGHCTDPPEARKVSRAPELAMRKPVKASTTATDSTGFGRTISKKSLDMAIRHMDITNSSGNIRSLSSTTLFPQSVRNSTLKTQPARGLSALASVDKNGSPQRSNTGVDNNNKIVINGTEGEKGRYAAKLSEVDIFESSRYDAILLKEDLKNTDWLHSADHKCDEGPVFDNGFESLPEPFSLL
ncbi:mucin-17 isoform X1 [Quillaja saponaria]|uniref:Mucin-17 isoform X1 n=1 Tax=Quillaja saponaria TaxID=32244 RepID=A0AAD7L3Y5_QUISA|nr:mucin-17 isoform X1 [Quillaja saponaria]